MVDQSRTNQGAARLRWVMRVASVLAGPAAGVAVVVLAKTFGHPNGTQEFWAGALAVVGAWALLFPGLFFRLDAPGWWFAGPRPKPSPAYLRFNRVAGVLMLVGSVLLALLLPAPSEDSCSGLVVHNETTDQDECIPG